MGCCIARTWHLLQPEVVVKADHVLLRLQSRPLRAAKDRGDGSRNVNVWSRSLALSAGANATPVGAAGHAALTRSGKDARSRVGNRRLRLRLRLHERLWCRRSRRLWCRRKKSRRLSCSRSLRRSRSPLPMPDKCKVRLGLRLRRGISRSKGPRDRTSRRTNWAGRGWPFMQGHIIMLFILLFILDKQVSCSQKLEHFLPLSRLPPVSVHCRPARQQLAARKILHEKRPKVVHHEFFSRELARVAELKLVHVLARVDAGNPIR